MKLSKLIETAESVLSFEGRKRKEKRKCLKHVLRKLQKYERKLQEQLESETDETVRAQLTKDIALAHAQRKKGLQNLKELKKKKQK